MANTRVLGVVGSRDYPNLESVGAYVESFVKQNPGASLVSGGARGVDRAAELAGHILSIDVVSYRPVDTERGLFVIHKWVNGVDTGMHEGRVFGRFASAAFYRNGLIVRDCTDLVAFWDGHSKGTQDSISKARQAEKLLEVFTPNE